MSKITKQNVGGTDYTMVGCALTGVCATSAADFVKVVTLSDGDVVSDGMTVVVTFANGNTAGNAPASQTIYSSDQVNYFSDSGLTQPFTLAPSGCYTIEYTGAGNAYTYQSFPVIQIGNVSAPLCTTDGKPAGGVVWTAGSSVSLLYTLGKFLVLPSARLTPYCTSANTTVSGGPLVSGGSVKIMFTSALTSANTTTTLVLNYNGVNITVKVPRNGSLVDYKASAVGNVNYFCQAYTTLELIYDGTNFIIVGNPVIYSDTDTTIYADGKKSDFNVKDHNIPRWIDGSLGKNITAYYQDGTLWKRIAGTNGFSQFEDIYVGDFFQMSRAITAPNQDSEYAVTGSQWVTIAGINTLRGNGDNISMDYNHLVMVPGKGETGSFHFGRKRMNSTNTTVGGYVASEMHTATLGDVVNAGSTANGATINQQLYAEFGSHLKTTRELLSNSMGASLTNRFGSAGGASNNWGWYSCQACLMSEVEVYGSTVWSSSGYDTGTGCVQLPLFAFSKKAVNNRSAYYWLKDVASSAYFAYVSSYGYAYCNDASYTTTYVRPRFVLGA